MADEKISAMPDASALTGAELVPIVQGGANKKTTLSNVVGGTTGQFQFNNSGAFGGAPLPFFGQTLPWVRPALNIGGSSSTFNTWLNQGGQAIGLGTDSSFSNGTPVAAGTGYVPGSVSTIAGGTLGPNDAYHLPTAVNTTLTVTDTQVVAATIVSSGTLGAPGSDVVTGTTGTGTMFQLNVTINSGGGIESIDSIATAGDYTINPTDITNEPVIDGAALTGAVVNVTMGALTGVIKATGSYATAPTSDPATEISNTEGGSGATWNIFYSDLSMTTDNVGGLPLVIGANGVSYTPPYHSGLFYSYVTGLLKPSGVAPWTITVGHAAVLGTGTSPSPLQIIPSIILYNSSTDKMVVLGWGQTFGTTWVINHLSPASLAGPNTFSTNGVLTNSYFAWWRVQNDGTNLIFSVSGEGIVFLPVYTETLASFIDVVDNVGFGVDRLSLGEGNAGVTSSALSILWNWVETSP